MMMPLMLCKGGTQTYIHFDNDVDVSVVDGDDGGLVMLRWQIYSLCSPSPSTIPNQIIE